MPRHRGLSAGLAAAQLKVLLLDGTTEERGFFPHIASRPCRACIYIVAGWPGPFLSLGVGAVGETPCLISSCDNSSNHSLAASLSPYSPFFNIQTTPSLAISGGDFLRVQT